MPTTSALLRRETFFVAFPSFVVLPSSEGDEWVGVGVPYSGFDSVFGIVISSFVAFLLLIERKRKWS
jgi:hypothetical protein